MTMMKNTLIAKIPSIMVGVMAALVVYSPFALAANANAQDMPITARPMTVSYLSAEMEEGDEVWLPEAVTPLSNGTETQNVSTVTLPCGRTYVAADCTVDEADNTVVTAQDGSTIILDGDNVAVYPVDGDVEVFDIADCIVAV